MTLKNFCILTAFDIAVPLIIGTLISTLTGTTLTGRDKNGLLTDFEIAYDCDK
jgi:hypothetical protein